MTEWRGKRILITGVCGTVGCELLRQVVAQEPQEVLGLDNNESELFFLGEEYGASSNVRFSLCDVRDHDGLLRKVDGADVVLHAAALKHVILCEQSPRDAIQTNIVGTQNIIDAALAGGVERVILTSSDKAVNPTNVMGTSKLMGERLMTAANALRRDTQPIFASTRFGNVLGSRGSVIPIFKRQIARGGPVTLTDRSMTRFIMTLEQAVRLVMESVFLARGGEVFVTKMPVVRIADLAEVMVDELAPRLGYEPSEVRIDVIGTKPGEKMYEELVNEEEIRRTIELEQYFVVTPAFKSVYKVVDYVYPEEFTGAVTRAYHSGNEPPMDREELRVYLKDNGLLELPSGAPTHVGIGKRQGVEAVEPKSED